MYASREARRQWAGRLIVCGFEGRQVTAELREILREVRPLGLVLFRRNIESTAQLAELNRELKALRPAEPLLLCVDQEGGRLATLPPPFTPWPPMRRLGALDDPQLTTQIGAALARELRALHFDVNFAPVVDVDTNPANPIIGDRAFGRDPARVARHGAALIRGLQGGGVGACAKHFPGHGDTDQDSHHVLPRLEHALARLQDVEWPPFAAAIAAGVGAIMTAHLLVMGVDAQLPATLSPRFMQQQLRQAMGFDGLILGEDIGMRALADAHTPEDIAVLGLQAGVDVFLACHAPEQSLALYRGIVRAGETEAVPHSRLQAAHARADAWRRQFWRPADPSLGGADALGRPDHAALLARLERG